MVVIYY